MPQVLAQQDGQTSQPAAAVTTAHERWELRVAVFAFAVALVVMERLCAWRLGVRQRLAAARQQQLETAVLLRPALYWTRYPVRRDYVEQSMDA